MGHGLNFVLRIIPTESLPNFGHNYAFALLSYNNRTSEKVRNMFIN